MPAGGRDELWRLATKYGRVNDGKSAFRAADYFPRYLGKMKDDDKYLKTKTLSAYWQLNIEELFKIRDQVEGDIWIQPEKYLVLRSSF